MTRNAPAENKRLYANNGGEPQNPDGFYPSEDLLDSLTFSLTDAVALVPGRAFIDGAGAPLMLILRHVRSHRRLAQLVHKIPRVVVLVTAQRYLPSAAGNPPRHVQRRVALGRPRGPGEPGG